MVGLDSKIRRYSIPGGRRTFAKISESVAKDKNITEGTVLNWLRELRYLGVVKKEMDTYLLRSSIQGMQDFKIYITNRLNSHVVVRSLHKLSNDQINVQDIKSALKEHYKGYSFSDKTWLTYANYLAAWLKYAGIDFGRRLVIENSRSNDIDAFTPQKSPEKSLEILMQFRFSPSGIERNRKNDKHLYDLKALGLVSYQGANATLTKRGKTLLADDEGMGFPQIHGHTVKPE